MAQANHDPSHINRLLGAAGLGRLNDPRLAGQLAGMIVDHGHLRDLLNACEPEKRAEMYNAVAPHLRFRARPPDAYIAESGELAERKQLPVQRDGKLLPFRPPQFGQALEPKQPCFEIRLKCRHCGEELTFAGLTLADAVAAARDEGWTYGLGEGREICPRCPVRGAA